MPSLKVAFQPPAKAAAAAAAAASAQPAAAEDVQLPFDILKQYGSESAAAAGARRRLRSSGGSSSVEDAPVLGFVMAVPAGAAGQAVTQRLEAVDTVKYVENDVCIRVTQGESLQEDAGFAEFAGRCSAHRGIWIAEESRQCCTTC
jgi:hypothetical protein